MFERMFGFFQKEKPTVSPSPVTPVVNGSAVYAYGSMAGCYGFSLDLDATLRNELQMTNYYREISTYPDCDRAIEQIVNEAVIVDEAKPPVAISLDDLPKEYGKLKTAIAKEFDTVLDLYSFNEECHDIFKRWYIDGRLYYFVTIDPKNPKKGILDVRYVDPRKIKRVTEVKKEKDENGVEMVTDVNEYYLFNDEGLLDHTQGIKIRTDSVIDVKSGLVDANTGEVISHLFKAIKPVNQLKMMEDALVIYRITRAPERRIFYVDTGNLPPQKAEQQVQLIMNKFRNKVVYDAKTGEVRNNRNYLSMMEDFWLPRREGGKSTEVTTLPGSTNLSDIADVEYFQNKLYQSMGVPRNRIAADNNFALGRPTEITREEILFSKFIQRLRNNFNDLFRNTLRVQLLAKNIVKESDWKKIVGKIRFEYQHDNYFEELKRQEIFGEKISQLQNIDQFKGMYFSREWIVKNVLRFGDEEWKTIQKEMKKEASDPSAADDLSSMGFDSNGESDKKDDKVTPPQKDEPPEKKKDEDAKEDGEEANE